MTTEAEGYKGHRVGSNKGKVHKAFDEAGKGDKGKAAAIKTGTRLQLQESTVRTWCSTWAKGKASAPKKAAPVTKKATAKKATAKKAAPKKPAAKRERITEASAAA